MNSHLTIPIHGTWPYIGYVFDLRQYLTMAFQKKKIRFLPPSSPENFRSVLYGYVVIWLRWIRKSDRTLQPGNENRA